MMNSFTMRDIALFIHAHCFAIVNIALAVFILVLFVMRLLVAVRRRRERKLERLGGLPYSRNKKRFNPSQTD